MSSIKERPAIHEGMIAKNKTSGISRKCFHETSFLKNRASKKGARKIACSLNASETPNAKKAKTFFFLIRKYSDAMSGMLYKMSS